MPKVKICEIKSGMRNIEVTGQIESISERKRVKTRYGFADVATAVLRDKTGSIHLNLWRQQIDAAREGETVRIKNAFVRVYGNRLELNIGKDGEMRAIDKNLDTEPEAF